jgi:hypothetical protein
LIIPIKVHIFLHRQLDGRKERHGKFWLVAPVCGEVNAALVQLSFCPKPRNAFPEVDQIFCLGNLGEFTSFVYLIGPWIVRKQRKKMVVYEILTVQDAHSLKGGILSG